jgi:CheY-like chemotaxis protein
VTQGRASHCSITHELLWNRAITEILSSNSRLDGDNARCRQACGSGHGHRRDLSGCFGAATLARDGIAALVESLGYNVITFTSAEHFIQSNVIAETTCLITDLQMPGLSGLELQETLRSQGYHTPVILVTGYPIENHRDPCARQRCGWLPDQAVRRRNAD